MAKIFHGGLAKLLTTGEHSDLLLSRDGESWRVHKAIVCAQSDFFLKACKMDSFKARTITVELVIGDSVTIKLMVDFIYTLDYDDTPDDNRLLCNTKIYEAADYYLLPHLAELAVENFKKAISEHWSMDHFRKALQYIYTGVAFPNTVLQALLIKTAVIHAKEVTPDPAFTAMLIELPALSRDFTVNLLSANANFNRFVSYRCRYMGCDYTWAGPLPNYGKVKCQKEHCPYISPDQFQFV